TLQVYIDDSYGTKTCEYAAIRKHEHTHVHIERSTLHKFKPRITHAVRKFFRKNPPLFVAYRQHLIRTRRNWEKSLQNVPEVMQLRKELRAAQEVRHQKIDTKESYAAVRKRCGNW
ncbi:MAG: hypothetical protein VX278_05690, partial [Myxococcota bacterium]|nr:hypothetical protein [Myxococcota bacterium]